MDDFSKDEKKETWLAKAVSVGKRLVQEGKHEMEKYSLAKELTSNKTKSYSRFHQRFRFQTPEPLYHEFSCKFATGEKTLMIGSGYVTKNYLCLSGALAKDAIAVVIPLATIKSCELGVAGFMDRFREVVSIFHFLPVYYRAIIPLSSRFIDDLFPSDFSQSLSIFHRSSPLDIDRVRLMGVFLIILPQVPKIVPASWREGVEPNALLVTDRDKFSHRLYSITDPKYVYQVLCSLWKQALVRPLPNVVAGSGTIWLSHLPFLSYFAASSPRVGCFSQSHTIPQRLLFSAIPFGVVPFLLRYRFFMPLIPIS